ncbi:MAG: hypothetical protein AAF732_14950 [Pseudomonadota bacterium]
MTHPVEFCLKCKRVVCRPCMPLHATVPERHLVVASDVQLLRRSHYHRLAIASAALEVSRRAFIDRIADALYGFDGTFVFRDGTPYHLPDIDDAFGDDDCFRWVSYFLALAETPPRQRPQHRVIERLRLIDLYFRVAYPERAKWIAR